MSPTAISGHWSSSELDTISQHPRRLRGSVPILLRQAQLAHRGRSFPRIGRPLSTAPRSNRQGRRFATNSAYFRPLRRRAVGRLSSPLPPKRHDNGPGPGFCSRSGRFLGVAMRSMGTFHLEGGFLAPASKPAGSLLALLVATLICVTSGTAVVLSLENSGTTEIQLTAMPVTKEPAHAGVQLQGQSSSRLTLNYLSRIANEDARSVSSASQPPSAENDQADLGPKQSPTGGAVLGASTNVGREEQAQSGPDPQKQPRLMVHRRRYYAPRLANKLLVSPILRPW